MGSTRTVVVMARVFSFLKFFGGTGVQIQGFTLMKQVLYHLSHTSSSFALVILEMGS
jgi:hypothetical protein